MKKVIAWLLVLALTAAISIGATLAYLTDTDEDVNVMTLGKVKIDQLEYERVDVESKDEDAEVQEFHDNKPLIPAVTENGFDYTPGDTYVDWEQIGKDGYTSEIWDPSKINNEVDKMVFVKNKGDYDAYVRSVFAFEAGNYQTLDEFKQMVHLNLNETDYTWNWQPTPVTIGESTYFVATATYNKVLEPGALTEISLSQIALDKTATNEDVEAFGETYQVLVKSQAVQADGFDDPNTALNEGFGTVNADNIPWENDSPTKGITLRKALHYLDGDDTGTKITSKVTNVVFGLNKEHTDVTQNYDGVLVDVEQDVPVYAYYVPNGTNYDVYFLANDDIYLPKDSSELFSSMSVLQTVDSTHLNTGRVENMYGLFHSCRALTDIVGITDWDTANVTNMGYAFYNCQNLQTLVTTNWDTGNVTNLGWTFYQCKNLKTIDTTNWNTSSVTSLLATFNGCEKLETLDVSNWDTSSITDPGAAFQNCKALKTLDVSNWDVSKVTRTTQMFNGCSGLESLPVSNWNFENLQKANIMFSGCTSLQTLDVSKWNMSTVVSIEGMFNHCEVIEVLDVSNWNVSNVTNMGTAFQQCWQLKTLDVSKWDTSSVTAMGWMFYGCKNLEVIDVSNWNVSKVTIMSHMFADCNKVKELKVDNWNVSSLQSLDATFNDCDSLTTINVSKWNTGNIREFSQSFEGCDNLTEIVGLENWNTSNGKTFDEMFNACKSLKVLNLSSFDTSNVTPGFKNVNGDLCKGFSSTFAGMNSVEKIILGANFRFAGNGSVAEQYQPKFPNPVAIDGQTTKWYNAANDTYYTASEIPEPEDVAVTYVAAIPPANP